MTNGLDDDAIALREARRILTDHERERLAIWNDVAEHIYSAMKDGKTEFALTLPVMEWLSWIDEVQDRPARNMSRLIRDDLLEQLGLATHRLHEELNFVIACGPSRTVSARYDKKERP